MTARETTPEGPARRTPGQAERRRPPRRSWLARNRLWVVPVAVVLLGMALWTVTRRGDDSGVAVGGLTGADFHSLAVDPGDPQRVFVGGHQAASVTTDGGRIWSEITSLRDADAMAWAFTSDAVFVSGHPGLSRSTDGGRTFERVNQGLPDTDVHAFGGTATVLYGASPAVGVFASTSGVGTWRSRTTSAGQSFFGRMVVDPADEQHLFAADARAGVAETSDGGRSWRALDTGLSAATWLSATGGGLGALVASGPAGGGPEPRRRSLLAAPRPARGRNPGRGGTRRRLAAARRPPRGDAGARLRQQDGGVTWAAR
ncbi:MAG: WD40/YVTN/BNR-like repeat-containing protein [Acidimicrobiales bacterium]